MNRENIERIVRLYYLNKKYILKYNDEPTRQLDVNFRKNENKSFEEDFPGIDNNQIFKKINSN